MCRVRQVTLVFLGSGLGGVGRYLMALWIGRTFGTAFPYGTIAINTIGSFVIVVIMQLGLAHKISPDARLLLTTGVIGGFTTYSTFNYETMAFWQQGGWVAGGLNIGVTVLLCLVAGGLGVWVGRIIAPA